jgi:hypothetical protein
MSRPPAAVRDDTVVSISGSASIRGRADATRWATMKTPNSQNNATIPLTCSGSVIVPAPRIESANRTVNPTSISDGNTNPSAISPNRALSRQIARTDRRNSKTPT